MLPVVIGVLELWVYAMTPKLEKVALIDFGNNIRDLYTIKNS